MKQLVVLSGKGGTGKTTISASLAYLASRDRKPVLVDADVDASNLEFLVSPVKKETHEFIGGELARIDGSRCISCGICAQVCRFDAVKYDLEYYIDPLDCEGCRACATQCPESAIQMLPNECGEWYFSHTPLGPFFHADLFPGEENSGKLVSELKQQARKYAEDNKNDLIIIDGPPGIGCPVVAATSGVSLALLIVEPTLSGLHDLKRILEVTRHFHIPAVVCINKYDINLQRVEDIRHYCKEQKTEVLETIPFDPVVLQAMAEGIPLTAYRDCEVKDRLENLWDKLNLRLPNIEMSHF